MSSSRRAVALTPGAVGCSNHRTVAALHLHGPFPTRARRTILTAAFMWGGAASLSGCARMLLPCPWKPHLRDSADRRACGLLIWSIELSTQTRLEPSQAASECKTCTATGSGRW